MYACVHTHATLKSVACTYLIAKAAYRWREVEGDYGDDISAIVVYLPLFDD